MAGGSGKVEKDVSKFYFILFMHLQAEQKR